MYDEMMVALLRIVLRAPVVVQQQMQEQTEENSPSAVTTNNSSGGGHVDLGLWEYVRQPIPSSASVSVTNASAEADALQREEKESAVPACWTNLLKWKAFTKKNRQRILAEFS